MKIAVIGASGYIGQNLIQKLLQKTNHDVIAISRTASTISEIDERLSKIDVDVFDTNKLHQAIADCEAVFFLVHMMGQKKLDYAKAEKKAAHSFCKSLENTKVIKIIFLGGLGNDQDRLSKHLMSRHNMGAILRSSNKIVIEFRASMIIGKGSIAYDIITNLVHKLPILAVPRWATSLTQPIGLNDALEYLLESLNIKYDQSEIIEIGGPDILSYEDLMKQYALWKGHKKYFVRVSIIPIWLSALWLNLFTPHFHAKVGQAMAESLTNQMTVTNNKANELFPEIKPKSLNNVFV